MIAGSATRTLPSDRTLLVERFRDELGDWRLVVHSPYGTPVHALAIVEFGDGKVVRETHYFAEPFEAPAWRSRWVEKMGE